MPDMSFIQMIGGPTAGLKSQDLFDHYAVLTEAGLPILSGHDITVEVFRRFLTERGFDKFTPLETIERSSPTDEILEINRNLLKAMTEDTPYAIRSDSLGDRGGTGLYKTVIFIPKGDEDDPVRLWRCEREVYAGEFTDDAECWRKKTDAEFGTALFVQAIQGSQWGRFFMPLLAGTAYTSYNDQPTVRVVEGFGSQAVEGAGAVFHAPCDNSDELARVLMDQDNIKAIDLDTGEVVDLPRLEEKPLEVELGYDSFNELFSKLAELKKHGDHYLEWVISDQGLVVVQCSDYADTALDDKSIDTDKYFLLAEGTDVMHSGRVTCKYVVEVKMWGKPEAGALAQLNRQLKDYLLIVPEHALSLVADAPPAPFENPVGRLALPHFSNASAIVERQLTISRERRLEAQAVGISLPNHTERDRGATHFQQLCRGLGILFIGAEMDLTKLHALPGATRFSDEVEVTYWHVDAEVIIDGLNKHGWVYIAKEAKKIKYSIGQLNKWTFTLRDTANWLCDEKWTQDEQLRAERRELSKPFYTIHYAIAPVGETIEFDPYELDKEIVEEEGMDSIIESLRTVLEKGHDNVDPMEWDYGLKDYLEDLLAHLIA